MKFQTKPEYVDAVQWNKPGDDPSVLHHKGCGYRMCNICGGYPPMDDTYYINQRGRIFYVNPGNWIITDKNGNINMLNDATFKEKYEPCTPFV